MDPVVDKLRYSRLRGAATAFISGNNKVRKHTYRTPLVLIEHLTLVRSFGRSRFLSLRHVRMILLMRESGTRSKGGNGRHRPDHMEQFAAIYQNFFFLC